MISRNSNRIMIALDGLGKKRSFDLVEKLGDRPAVYKIHDLWDREGPSCVRGLKDRGARRVWVDLKLNDIPQTVKLRSAAVHLAGGDIVSVMAKGEVDMMMAAVAEVEFVFAVTELTSLTEEQVHLVSGNPRKGSVLYLARLARLAGVNGIICSPQEVGVLSKRPEFKGLEFVTPGVRSAGAQHHDQKVVDTPRAAILNGATYEVIGREVTQADDPVAAFDRISQEIEGAEAELRSTKV